MATLPSKAKPNRSPIRATKKRQRTASPNEAFYTTEIWKGLRRQVMQEQPICVWYGKRANCQKISTICDHIVAMPDGGSMTDRRNLQGMCKSCSNHKTNMEIANRKSKIKRKITPNGLV